MFFFIEKGKDDMDLLVLIEVGKWMNVRGILGKWVELLEEFGFYVLVVVIIKGY